MVKNTNLILIVMILALSPYFQASGQANTKSSLYNLKFEKLDQFDQFNTASLTGAPSLWVIFQPNCKSCKSQFKNLSCLPKEVLQVALGINGNRQSLAKAIRQAKYKGYMLQADKAFKNKFKILGTPTSFIVDQNGRIQKKITGLVACSRINDYFAFKEKNTKN